MISLLSTLLNGLSLGSVYAIIALGYTMVYGITFAAAAFSSAVT